MCSFEPKIAAESKAFDRVRDRPTAERPIDRASEQRRGGREQLSKDGHLKLTTGVVGSRNSPSFTSPWIACGEREKEGKGEGRKERKFVRNYTNMTSAL